MGDYKLLALKPKKTELQGVMESTFKDTIKNKRRRLNMFTTVEINGPNKFQVGVYSPNAVDITTVLKARANRRLVQVLGLAFQPVGEQ